MHGIYITVIVILAIALIFKSSNGNNGLPENSHEEEKKEETILRDPSVTIITNTNPKPTSTITVPRSSSSTSNNQQSSSNTQTTTPNTTATTQPASDPLLPITGQISFFIDEITKEVKGEDWGKVTEIKFTITNQKPKSFYPKVLIYCWDDNDPADVKTYVEEEIYFNKLESGKSITEEKEVSISFNEIDEEKTCYI